METEKTRPSFKKTRGLTRGELANGKKKPESRKD